MSDACTRPDEGLADRIAASDEAAFETLFRRLSGRVFRYVVGMTGAEATAHDVVQETFAKLWSVRESLAEVDAIEPYVFQMARRRVYNLNRDERIRRSNEALLDVDDLAGQPQAPDEAVDDELLRRLLDRWIAELPERQREALTLRRIQGLSHDAIANVMGISKNTVNTHLVRAMEHLRSRMKDLES